MNVLMCLGVFLVGLHHVPSKSGAVTQYWNEIELPDEWGSFVEQINEGIQANETIEDLSKLNFTLERDNVTRSGDDSRPKAEIHPRGNDTGMSSIFFEWRSKNRSGNVEATRPIYPWAVAVQSERTPSDSHLCSGNILTKLHVLSTCRCLSTPTGASMPALATKDPSDISVVAGLSMLKMPLKEQLLYGQVRKAIELTIHPYCTPSQKFDYGVIELEYYLYYTDRVLPMPDPFVTFTEQKGKISPVVYVEKNHVCHSAGWHLKPTFVFDESKPEQQGLAFVIVNDEYCVMSPMQPGYHPLCTKVVGENLTGEIFGSFGDIGSGLVCENRVIGILSFNSADYVAFASISGALSFIWPFYQEQNENYAISLSQLHGVSSGLHVFALYILVSYQ